MNTKRVNIFIMCLFYFVLGTWAQEENRLYIPDIEVNSGSDFVLPIHVQNSSSKISGIQFTLSLPQGIKFKGNEVELTERTANYKVRTNRQGSWLTVMLFSTTNVTLKANAGVVLNIPVSAADTLTQGRNMSLDLTKVVLSDSLGNNVLTDFEAGTISVKRTPIFQASGLSYDKQNIMPGDTLHVGWTVTNIGGAAAESGWKEYVKLISADEDEATIATIYNPEGSLQPSQSVQRQSAVVLPRLLGLDGQAKLIVEVVPNSDSGVSQGNRKDNTVSTQGYDITVGKCLYLTLPTRLYEGTYSQPFVGHIGRSGSWRHAQTVTLVKQGDDRLMMLNELTINEGQSGTSINLAIVDDNLINTDTLFTITASVDGYNDVSSKIVMENDDLPPLLLTADKSILNEGDDFTMTLTTAYPPTQDTEVYINCESPKYFTYPQTVILPAGQGKISFGVTALDNEDVTDTLSVEFTVSAQKYESGKAIILLADDDIPDIDLELVPTVVNEGAGTQAILATLRKTNKLNSKITVHLSDDSDGYLQYYNKTITLDKNVEEKQFTIGVVDNNIVEEDIEVHITASIYIATCSCQADPNSGGSVTRSIKIIDNDKPSLKISSENTAIKEGSSMDLTISLNTVPTSPVTVELSSNFDDFLLYGHSVVIPAGQSIATFKIFAKENEEVEDTRIIVFNASAEDFAPATFWVQLTDQTLPDVSISNLTITPERVEAGQMATISVTIANTGNAVLPSLARVNFYINNITKELGHVYTADTLTVGGKLVLNYELRMPITSTYGNHTLRAVVNENKTINEVNYSNNDKSTLITLLPAFTATAQTEKTLYVTGETVTISGKATGNDVSNTNVEIYFINEGYRQTLIAKTDEEGNYSVDYTLPNTLSGHFIVGACCPNENLRTEMASFDVFGLRLSACSNNVKFDMGDTYQGTMTITNAVNLKQTGLKVEQGKIPDDCVFAFTIPETIEGSEDITLNFTITSNEVSSDGTWHKMPITITSNEGASTDYSINYYINSRLALLSSNVISINTTMTKGVKRDYPITITNKGKGETGKITLALPEWINTSTPREMASLTQGEEATIVLQLEPTESMQLNVPVEGNLAINCENGVGIPIHFSITPVSESEGKLIVDVVDEFTFETQEAPHVSNAKIEVKRPTTGELIAQGNSEEDGKFTVTLPEGQYAITVTAENHEEYNNQIIVDAGKDNNHEAFVSYEAVTYSWDVVETEVEDSYEIETIVKYDTRVPKPVILISLPSERPEDGSIIPIVVTNKGFINAEDVNVSLAISGNWNIEFLTEPYLAKLAANQSEVFYAKITSASAYSTRRKAPPTLNECLSLQAKLRAHYICGNKYDNTVTADDLKRWGECLEIASNMRFSYGGGGGSSYSPGGVVGGGYGSGWWQIVPIPVKTCNSGSNGNGGNGGSGNSNDWTNPDYLDNPNDPIALPRFNPQKDKPDEQDCNSKAEPILVYKIIPVIGSPYLVKGVAADGLSQVKLVLDPDLSTVPPENCENFTDFEWRLSADIGRIEGDSYKEAIYTAPEDFPDKFGYRTYVEATLWYTQRTDDHTTYGRHTEPIKIEIIRPPVVFVHGLGDNDACWYRLDKWLTDLKYYEENYNYRVNYKDTNTDAFSVNVPVIGRGMLTARRQALNKGFIASRCDLVGHSMGGILSRLYAQNDGDDEINRIITVNTPHAGSEFGDAVMGHDILLTYLARIWYWKVSYDSSIDAIRDLAVESEAIAQLNSGPKPSIPVYALATQKNEAATLLTELGIGAGLDMGGELLIKTGMASGPLGIFGITAGLASKYLSHFVNDDMTQIGVGDLIVSTASQIGGCDASTVIANGPWHVNSPRDLKVIMAISDLLLEDKTSNTFSRNWFSPSPRTFDHSTWGWEFVFDNLIDFIGDTDKFNNIANKLHLEALSDEHRKTLARQLDEKGLNIENISLEDLVSNIIMIKDVSQGGGNFHDGSVDNNTRSLKRESTIEDKRHIKVELNDIPSFTEPVVTISYDDMDAAIAEGYNVNLEVPSYYSGNATLTVYMKNDDGNVYYQVFSYKFDKPEVSPVSLEAEEIFLEKGDSAQIVIYCKWEDEQITRVKPSNIIIENQDIANYNDGEIIGLKKGQTPVTVSYAGLISNTTIRVFDDTEEGGVDNESSNSVCSTITLSFKQEMVMTRQAFRGTLTVNNGDAVNEMKDVKLNLEGKDEDGNNATSHEFQINAESLEGFEGEIDLTAGWKLEAKGTGVATILFIPTKYAALTEPKKWSFGGTFSYTDPTTGLAVTKELYPVTLTVNPSPNLTMDYFVQRDVLGDDALTEDIVEPMVPAEFSLLINNKGYGDANNVKMVTNQPEIIDNEKGLLIDFEILSSQLNGGEKTLALGQSVATDFGTIPAGKTSYAQWWFTSSLLGHFTEYDVKATHLTSHDNPDLSLLDTVTVHELIHTLTIPKAETMRGFLVNDVKDSNDLPDMLYITDGTVKAVAMASATLIDEGDNIYTLTVEPTATGWNYGSLIDPTSGHKVLSSVTRNSDGTSISLNNFWQTDRTLRDGKDPLYEYRLHFADEMAATGETYTLTFENKPMTILDVETIEGVPEQGGIATEPVEKLTVNFNKDIAATTFTTEDLELTRAGNKLDVEKIVITKITERQFELDIKELTAENGYYALTIHTAGIKDTESYSGEYGRKQTWTQYKNGKIDVQQNCELAEGWNWISTNLEENENTDAIAFLESIKDQTNRLVSQENELMYDPVYGLIGGLSTIKTTEGYKLQVNESVTFSQSGITIEPETTPIVLRKGWNWIGYLPAAPLLLNDALDGLTPMEDDVLEGQDVFSTFSDNKWMGTLTEMKPGEGYMYYSGQASSFCYPKVYPSNLQLSRKTSDSSRTIPWQYDAHKYSDNMAVIGKLYLNEIPVTEEKFIVGAFYNNECRGVGKMVDGLIFMTVHGSLNDKGIISFKAYDQDTENEYNVLENISFTGQKLGLAKKPFLLHSIGVTDLDELSSKYSISPRPLRNTLFINGDISNLKEVLIYSTNGQILINTHYNEQGINIGKLKTGVYVVVLINKDGATYHEKVYKINN